MFTSKSSDASLNSQHRSNTNLVRFNSKNNLSVPTNDQNVAGRVAGLLNSSSSHMENQFRSTTAPIVSVISSSMDLFGSDESKEPHNRYNIDGTTTTSSYSIAANLTATTRNSEMSKYGNISAQLVAGINSEKVEQTSSSKPKSVKRAMNSKPEDDAARRNQKKSKPSTETTLETSTHSVDRSDAEKNALDMSFERAAVVAALTTLYGAASEKRSAKLPTKTNASTFGDTPSPLPLPKQVKYKESKFKPNMTSSRSGGDMVQEAVKRSSSTTTAIVKPAADALGPTHFGSGKNMTEVTENSEIKVGQQSTKKKMPFHNDSPTNSRKSSVTQYPSQYDVLLGRGKSNKNHPGNVWFQGTNIFSSHSVLSRLDSTDVLFFICVCAKRLHSSKSR